MLHLQYPMRALLLEEDDLRHRRQTGTAESGAREARVGGGWVKRESQLTEAMAGNDESRSPPNGHSWACQRFLYVATKFENDGFAFRIAKSRYLCAAKASGISLMIRRTHRCALA